MTEENGRKVLVDPKCQLTAPIPYKLHIAIQQLAINRGSNFSQEVRRLLQSAVRAEGVLLDESPDGNDG